MTFLLGLLRNPRVLIALAIVAMLAATHIGVAAKAYEAGVVREAAKWQAQEIERQEQAAEQYRALQSQLAAREAELAEKQQEAANAVERVRTEYLPGKTIVRREVVEVPAYRDCRVSGSVRDAINGALAGRPVPGAVDGGGAARVPGDARADG